MNPQIRCDSDVRAEIRGDGCERILESISVSSRIPKFWADQMRLWFVQFEAAIESKRLSNTTKQNLVVTKLLNALSNK